MRMIHLRIENVKRIKAVEITPKKGVTRVGGKNANGKTSVLDAIEMALAGKRAIPTMPVRQGEAYARIVMEFDSGMTVVREFDANGSSRLVVRNAAGPVKAQQTFLDELTGKGIAFDPLAFLRKDSRQQLETLQRMVGLDFSDIEAQITRLDKERAEAGRDVHGRQTQIDGMPEYPDVPAEEVSVSALADDLNAAISHNRKIDDAVSAAQRELILKEQALRDARRAEEEIAAAIAKAEEEIKRWQAFLAKKQAEFATAVSAVELAHQARERADSAARMASEVAATEKADERPIRLAIAGAESANRQVRANQARQQLIKQFREAKSAYEELTRQIDALHRRKGEMIAAAKMPVDGLSFGLQGVLYRGVPFEQASSAEQYRVSTTIGMELCPRGNDAIRIALIRDGSLLDDQSMSVIEDVATQYDADLWIEVVTNEDDEGKADVIIQDGGSREPHKKEN